jgi:surface antigen
MNAPAGHPRAAVLAAFLAAGLAACEGAPPPSAPPGVAGRPAAPAAAAGSAGTLIGGELGAGLPPDVRAEAAAAELRALDGNVPVQWREGPDAHGRIRPLRSYERDGRTCRDYVHTLTVGGQSRDARGTACALPGGGWRVSR